MTLTLTYVVKIMTLSEGFSHRSLSVKKLLTKNVSLNEISVI